MSKLLRISVPISHELNDRLAEILPWGVKAQVIRELMQLFVSTYDSPSGKYVAQDLLKGNCRLVCSKFEQRGNNDETV